MWRCRRKSQVVPDPQHSLRKLGRFEVQGNYTRAVESFNICKAGDVDASGGSMDGDFGGEVCRLRRLTAGEGTDGPLKREAVRRALSAPSWSKRAVTNPGNRVSSRLS